MLRFLSLSLAVGRLFGDAEERKDVSFLLMAPHETTHDCFVYFANDMCRRNRLDGTTRSDGDRVKVIFHPEFLSYLLDGG
ncbi:hypothetical protein D918_03912 [Trichuris suis]|nr:hypothetical protein D918_03912 [Trichuris suis]